MDGGTGDVTDALQQAYSGLLRAVELERRRRDGKLDAAAVVADLHELRTMMSAAAEMMRTFQLAGYQDSARWGPAGQPDDMNDVTPAQVISDADDDLTAAYEHLQQAAQKLTSARRRIAVLQ
jgi:hypothetical protein